MKSTVDLWSVPLIFTQYLKLEKVVDEILEVARLQRTVLSKVGAGRKPASRAARAATRILILLVNFRIIATVSLQAAACAHIRCIVVL
ncbi:hypothetical protein AVEN_172292-1 [Araneus ventricosus]|uniref:Uncharacterized protein n=1 Tax=Araneus ventricosus TaxID=182803 RepID=A0A4Y2X7B9_ARAVE|nr:hypothetical protein AVEN_172292-1 [Araneus ventricosus]